MRFMFFLPTLLVSIVFSLVAAAAVASETEIDQLEVLTPQALVAAAELHNHSLLSLAAAVEAAQFRVGPASALQDPMFSYTIWPNSIGSDIGTRQGGRLSQSFPWPGKRDLAGTIADQHASMAFEDREVARRNVIAAAKVGYSEWHYLHRAIEINTASQDLFTELIRIAEVRYAAGQALQQDVFQAEVERALLQQQRLTLDQQRTSVQANLNELINREPDRPLPPPAPLDLPGPLPDIEAARAVTEISHPQLRRLEAAVGAARSTAELEDQSSRPDFNAYVSYADTWDEVDKRLQLGVSINLPLGRDKRRAERDAANAEVRRAEHRLQGERTMLLAALEVAYAQVVEADAAIQLYQERLLPLADVNLDAALSDYQSGAGQVISVITAERQKLTTEQGFERARADYWRRRAELERVTGEDHE